MLLLLLNLEDRRHSLTITFNDGDESFTQYKRVFGMLRFAEQRYLDVREYRDQHVQGPGMVPLRRTSGSRVSHIIKQSPLEIGAFVADNWLELLLFIVGVQGNVVGAFKKTYQSFDEFVDLMEGQVREQLDDFPAYERERLMEVWSWFMALSEDQKDRFLIKVKWYGRAIRHLRRIVHVRTGR